LIIGYDAAAASRNERGSGIGVSPLKQWRTDDSEKDLAQSRKDSKKKSSDLCAFAALREMAFKRLSAWHR
jgi:hypothetical protein